MIDRSFSPDDAITVKGYYSGMTGMTLYEKTEELAGMLMIKLGETRMQRVFCKYDTVYCYQYGHYTNDGTPMFISKRYRSFSDWIRMTVYRSMVTTGSLGL